MHETPLAAWESYYVIVGSSAAALTGLQFVVITLIAEMMRPRSRGRGESIAAFGTPNVVHFCSALLVSAILSVPWRTLGPAGLALFATGVAGCLYSWAVVRKARRQRGYEPVLEDWVWHAILPLTAYATLLLSGVAIEWGTAAALLAIAAATLLLVFIGIHNSWDTVTYVTTTAGAEEETTIDAEEGVAAVTDEPGRTSAPR